MASGGCNFGKTRPWLGLVDLSRIPSGTFFREVHPGSEMASQNDQNGEVVDVVVTSWTSRRTAWPARPANRKKVKKALRLKTPQQRGQRGKFRFQPRAKALGRLSVRSCGLQTSRRGCCGVKNHKLSVDLGLAGHAKPDRPNALVVVSRSHRTENATDCHVTPPRCSDAASGYCGHTRTSRKYKHSVARALEARDGNRQHGTTRQDGARATVRQQGARQHKARILSSRGGHQPSGP